MIAARIKRGNIIKLLLEGEHINLDIQENVRQHTPLCEHYNSIFLSTVIQKTGWSALHFSAVLGDSVAVEMLLKVGANAHLQDKVCPTVQYTLFILHCLFFLGKNGLTALHIAEVEARKRVDHHSYQPSDFLSLVSLLRKHMKKGSTILPGYHVSL